MSLASKLTGLKPIPESVDSLIPADRLNQVVKRRLFNYRLIELQNLAAEIDGQERTGQEPAVRPQPQSGKKIKMPMRIKAKTFSTISHGLTRTPEQRQDEITKFLKSRPNGATKGAIAKAINSDPNTIAKDLANFRKDGNAKPWPLYFVK